MISAHACAGCREDFYNHRGDGARCWSAKDGRMMTRYRIHYLTEPTQKGAFTKVRVPSCYRQVNRFVFYNELPDFVKASDLNRARRVGRV
jgi:hypothetical protein